MTNTSARTVPPGASAEDKWNALEAVKRVESLLEAKFGATGRGAHEKLSSVEHRVPEEVHRAIRYMATVRNKLAHEAGYQIDDYLGFLRQARRVIEVLEAGPVRPATPSPALDGGSPAQASNVGGSAAIIRRHRPNWFARILLSVGVLFIALWLLGQVTTPPNSSSTLSEATPSEATQPLAGNKSGPPGDGERGQKSRDPGQLAGGGTPASSDAAGAQAPMRSAADVAQAIAEGRSAGLGNSALRINSVTLKYSPDTWGRLAPKITVQVTNTSDVTISSATVEARLYLDDETKPAAVTGNSYLFFGDLGLAAGASTEASVSLESFKDREWMVPDALNAKRRMAAVRVRSTSDGKRADFGDSAEPLRNPSPSEATQASAGNKNNAPGDDERGQKSRDAGKPAGGGAPALSNAAGARAPMRSAADVAKAIAEGRSAGLGNSALRINSVALKYSPDTWGHLAPKITVQVTNMSDVTISSATVEARLYLDDETKPAAVTGNSYLFFGDRGLAAGASTETSVSLESFKDRDWMVPDALHAKRRMAAVRVRSTSDGKGADFGDSAEPLRDPRP